MPKLNATIDQIELKPNKVIGNLPSYTWTDEQYPSAKTLYGTYCSLVDFAHPIGSILITSTNANPGPYIGCSWELIDKGFADISGYLNASHFTASGASLVDASSSLFLLKDHMISLRLNLINNVALSDSTIDLGFLNLNALGITSLAYTVVSDVTSSDGGQCTIGYSVGTNGHITATDVLTVGGGHSLAAGNTFSIHINQAISHPEMLDAYCNKFYWKRVA
jgi:hypothetical protein